MYNQDYSGDIKYISQLNVHQSSKHPLYSTWRMMNVRCLDDRHKAYKSYGGRGINVHLNWRWDNSCGLYNFISSMGDRPDKSTLERVNNDLPYDESNCIWASKKIQQNNRRLSCLNTTGVQGVSVFQNSYVAQITLNGRNKLIGIYSLTDITSAKERYDLVKETKMLQGDDIAEEMVKTLDIKSPTNKRLRLGKTSRYYGVSWSIRDNIWRTCTSYRVTKESPLIQVTAGKFTNEEDAHLAILDLLKWIKESGFYKNGITNI